MVAFLFTLGFLVVFLMTKSYSYLSKYYSTILYVSLVAVGYPLICRGYMVWSFRAWGQFTDKASELMQAAVLFPSVTVLFLRFLPSRVWVRTLYFLGFFSILAVMELIMISSNEIIYQHGWTLGWSLFIDFCLFALLWIHARNWKAALLLSLCILIFLVIVFRVPVTG